MAREESRQWPRLDGFDPVGQSTRYRELDNVRVPEHLQVRFRKVFAQRGNGRQRQDEITNRPSPNHQNLPAK